MKCYARWEEDDANGVFLRDQTILHFGDSWELLASFVLLNPGSALPKNNQDKTGFLRSKNLPYFVETVGDENYVEFSVDPLMRHLFFLFRPEYSGGVIKLYNLFNLKNQDSNLAVNEFQHNLSHPKMFARDNEIRFNDAPVVIASGKVKGKDERLYKEAIRYASLVDINNLYSVSKIADKQFSIVKAAKDDENYVDSYHPSYSFTRGNKTTIGALKS